MGLPALGVGKAAKAIGAAIAASRAAAAMRAAARAAAQRAARLRRQGARTCAGCRQKVRCFEPPAGGNRSEFDRQLQMQQDQINGMTPDEVINNITSRRNGGRPAGDAAARARARTAERDAIQQDTVAELRRQGYSQRDAERAAASAADDALRGMDALHALDFIAGGDGLLGGFGQRSENRSIGGQWRGGRADELLEMAQDAKRDGAGRMNVQLRRC
jgi:hypothetical protein